MGWLGRSKARRREVLRQRGERKRSLLLRLCRREVLMPVLLLGLFYAGVCVIVLYGQTSLRYRLGQRIDSPIFARVRFVYHDPLKRAREQENARRAVPNIYRLNADLIAQVEKDLAALAEAAKSAADYSQFVRAVGPAGWQFDEESFKILKRLVREQPEQWRQISRQFVQRLAETPVICTLQAAGRDPQPLVDRIILVGPDGKDRVESRMFVADLAEREGLRSAVEQIVSTLPEEAGPLRGGFEAYLERLFGFGEKARPVYEYDAEETRRRMEQAAAAIDDRVEIRKGQLLLDAGVIDNEAKISLLQAEHKAYLKEIRSDPDLRRKYLLRQFGYCAVALAVTAALGLYTLNYKPRVLKKYARTAGLSVLILAAIGLGRWLALSNVMFFERISVLAVVLCGTILAVAYDRRYAFGVTVLCAVLVTLAVRGQLSDFLVMAASAAAAIYMLDDIRTRTKPVVVGIVAALAGAAVSFACDAIGMQEVSFSIDRAARAGGAGFVAGLLLGAFLPIIERAFGVVTSLTLLEWCDVSKPLLRRLAQEAPGTYNHSLVLGTMAEAAAEAVGANGLLARVGAYYHDIGKINKPGYFVENQQSGATSWHEKLAPTMSLLIIIGHVKDGLELARQYGLPRVLWPFIAEHHGTTIVKYFYYQAAERQGGSDRTRVVDTDFRYPGPKPRSKETAILMLCDSVEGAVRALSEPTPGRIESVVHQIVMDRLTDGQFDECDITLRELRRVEESLVKSLLAIYHGRVVYPSAKERPKPAVVQERAAQTV